MKSLCLGVKSGKPSQWRLGANQASICWWETEDSGKLQSRWPAPKESKQGSLESTQQKLFTCSLWFGERLGGAKVRMRVKNRTRKTVKEPGVGWAFQTLASSVSAAPWASAFLFLGRCYPITYQSTHTPTRHRHSSSKLLIVILMPRYLIYRERQLRGAEVGSWAWLTAVLLILN